MILVAVGGDVKEGVTLVNMPHSARRCAGSAPAGLVHVQALAGAHARSQLLVGVRQRLAGAR